MKKDYKFQVVEEFLSLQGESSYMGKVCYFIRLADCNLHCSYCDTRYACLPDAGVMKNLQDIVQRVIDSKSRLVEITGGEPLIHDHLNELCEALLAAGLTVLLETNGSLPINNLPSKVIKVMDCKTPSSEMSCYNCYENFDYIDQKDEIKFVIGSLEDYDFAKMIIEKYDLSSKSDNILFSPVWGSITFEKLAQWVVDDRLTVRLQIQQHKIIWGANAIGV